MSDGQTIDAFHFGRFHLVQPKGHGHRSGMDAMVLSAMVEAEGPVRVADLGAGAGAAGLSVAARIAGAEVVLVEKSPDMAAYARASLALAGNAWLADRVSLLEADVSLSGAARIAAGLGDDMFDHVIMNPPFNDPADRQGQDKLKAEAHLMHDGMFEAWIKTAGAILKPGGQLALIARPQSLPEVIAACGKRFGGLEITFLHPRAGAVAIRFLLSAIKGSRARPVYRFPLVLHDTETHKFAAFVDDLNNGRASYGRLQGGAGRQP